MNPTRWHVEEVLRRLAERRDRIQPHLYTHDGAKRGLDVAADIVREVMTLEPPKCKCGHGYDVHTLILPELETDTACHSGRGCPCEKYDPAPKVSE